MASRFPFIKQEDSMQCGIACLQMICTYYGQHYSNGFISTFCHATTEGISLLGICKAATFLGFKSQPIKTTLNYLNSITAPCILHWNQNHFVILYKIKDGKYYISDPGKGKIIYTTEEFKNHWISMNLDGEEKGIVLFLEPTSKFGSITDSGKNIKVHSLNFLNKYISPYKKYFIQIAIGLFISCILQLILPFLTQSIVDVGIKHDDISFIWLVLLGELMIVIGRTATDFIRRWLLLHISMRINISLVSDFFIKLLKLPMYFFDTKLMGDLLQRINDHSRVQSFLTNQILGVVFTFLSFLIFGIVLFIS